MSLHKSSVNFKNLIQDLADMYPFEISEVVLIELIANALDAGATKILINYDPERKVLIVTDNGKGMNKSQFDEYHDFAAGLKRRGEGIGFAGLGAKVSFNIANRVITETKSKSFSGGSKWYLKTKNNLEWEDIEQEYLYNYGTRVKIWFRSNANITYSSSMDFIRILRRHYFSLLDPKFLELYEKLGFYSKELRFSINGQIIKPVSIIKVLCLDKVKEIYPERGRKQKFGYGIFGVSKSDYPVASDICGVLLCTHGKVIKADLFKQFPGALGPRIFGIFEIPEFINFLTTAKTDFIRKGRHKKFEGIYGPIRQVFKDWLKEIGIEPTEVAVTDEATMLEKELKKILEDVPELSNFFGFWARKNILSESLKGNIVSATQDGGGVTFPVGEGTKKIGEGFLDSGENNGKALREVKSGDKRAEPISRTSKRGPKISFAKAPDSMDLAWVEGNNIVINAAHSSYRKVSSNARVLRTHNLFAIATAILRFINSEIDTPNFSFIDKFMKSWGDK